AGSRSGEPASEMNLHPELKRARWGESISDRFEIDGIRLELTGIVQELPVKHERGVIVPVRQVENVEESLETRALSGLDQLADPAVDVEQVPALGTSAPSAVLV